MEEPGAAHARLRTEAGRRGRSLEPAHEHRQQQLRHGTALHRREWEGEGLLVNCELSCIRSCFRGTATPGPQTSHLVSTVELGANLLIHEEGLSTGYVSSVHGLAAASRSKLGLRVHVLDQTLTTASMAVSLIALSSNLTEEPRHALHSVECTSSARRLQCQIYRPPSYRVPGTQYSLRFAVVPRAGKANRARHISVIATLSTFIAASNVYCRA